MEGKKVLLFLGNGTNSGGLPVINPTVTMIIKRGRDIERGGKWPDER